MKRILTFLLLIGCVSLMGFRGAGWRGERTVAGEYTFSDSTTVDDNLVVTGAMDADSTNTDHLTVNDKAVFGDTVTFGGVVVFAPGWMEFDQLRPATNDSTSSSLGESDNPFADIHAVDIWVQGGGRHWGRDTSGADSFWIYNDGTWQVYGSDNNIAFAPTKNTSWYLTTTAFQPANDTVRSLGTTSYRLKEVFAKRIMLTLPDGTDTLVLSATGITGTAYIRGTATFDATKTADTLLITGGTASDFYWIQVKGSTVPTSPFTCVAKVGSLIVNCAVGDTAVARAGGYNWLRMQ